MVGDKQLAKTKLTEKQIYERIWKSIAERRLPPGTRLKEERLCEIFGASRPRIRRALDQLTHDGLVSHIPNRGAFVTTPSVEEARDVFFTRRVVERGVIDALKKHGAQDKLAALETHIAEEREALAERDTARIIRLSGAFHMLLAELAASPLLAGILRDLVSKSTLVTAVFQPKCDTQCGPDEHAAIVAALADGDFDTAKSAMDVHLQKAEHTLKLETSSEGIGLQDDILGTALSEDL